MPRSVAPIDGLTERQRLAVHLLAQGKTIRETARQLGVSERTIWCYRQRPAVQNAIYFVQTEMINEGGGRSLTSIPEAMRCLKEIVADPEARDADKIAASRALINSANSFAERRILERQIADLESTLRNLLGGKSTPESAAPEVPLDPLLASAAPDDGDDDDDVSPSPETDS